MNAKRQFKKILLVNPPGKVFLWPDGTPAHRKHCTPPLGLAYLAASVLEKGYEVEVIDMLAEGYGNEILKDSFLIYGLSSEELLTRIEQAQPDLIGISVLFSFIINEVIELCGHIKQRFPGLPIVLGGHHPSGAPNEVMKSEFVDFVLVAESDISLVLLLDSLNGTLPFSQVPNLYYRAQGQLLNTLSPVTPVRKGSGWSYYRKKDASIPLELDKLPYPAWSLLQMDNYWRSDVRIGGGDVISDKYAVMITTRGCPHACYFCLTPLMNGYRGYRVRSTEEVMREIRWLVNRYGAKEIGFLDDNFFVGKPRVKKLLKMIAAEFPDVLFSVPGGTEANALDYEIIDLMAEANFYKVLIAVEAGDQAVQDSKIDKQVKVGRLPEMIHYLRAKGIETRALFMIGFPGETREQIQRTVDLARKLEVDDFYISIVTPMPGTPLYDECIDKNLFIDCFDTNDIRFSAAKIRLPDTTPEELERLRRDVWLEKFGDLRARMVTRVDQRILRFTDIDDYQNVGFTSLQKKPIPSESEG